VNSRIYPEIQQQQDTENSGSEYNGEDEPDSDGHLSDDALQPDTELGCTLASLSYKDKVLVIPFFFSCSLLHLMFISPIVHLIGSL